MQEYVTSPIKVWRENLGLSQSKLAQLAQLSEETIIRYEQLLYTDLSPRLITALSDGMGFATGRDKKEIAKFMEQNYHRAQYIRRAETNWQRGTVVDPETAFELEFHPFIIWRESLGFDRRMAFCRAACVSPPQLLSLETGSQSSIPKSFRLALDPFCSLQGLDNSCRGFHALLKKDNPIHAG